MSLPHQLPRQDVRRVLVIRRKALGDALVTLPAILRLVAAFPRAAVDLVIDRPLAPLFDELAQGFRVLAWPPATGTAGWLAALRRARYDLVLDYLGSPRTAIWCVLSGAPLRVGYDLPGRRWAYNVRVPRNRIDDVRLRQFAGECFLDPLRKLGFATGPWRSAATALGDLVARLPDDTLGQRYRQWLARWTQSPNPRVALTFSATWPAKAWRVDEACRLYRKLRELSLAPVFVTGPGDETLAERLHATLPDAEFAPPTDLCELAHLLAHCSLFVGTDCGARHLATCVGLPTVTIFGPTDSGGWNPESPRHVSVRTGVECSPCNRTLCNVSGHPCLDDLPAEMVLDAIAGVLPLARQVASSTDRKESARCEE